MKEESAPQFQMLRNGNNLEIQFFLFCEGEHLVDSDRKLAEKR